MTDAEGGHDEVGGVADEAAKLLGVLSGWARDHGADTGHGLSDLAEQVSRGTEEHLATGAPECTWCPVCRVVHVVRDTSPEVRTHLTTAASSLLKAAAALLATPAPGADPDGHGPGAGRVQHIELDETDE